MLYCSLKTPIREQTISMGVSDIEMGRCFQGANEGKVFWDYEFNFFFSCGARPPYFTRGGTGYIQW